MGFRDPDQPRLLSPFFQSWDERDPLIEFSIRRLRALDGKPVFSAQQMADMAPLPFEEPVVEVVFNRFSKGLRKTRRS